MSITHEMDLAAIEKGLPAAIGKLEALLSTLRAGESTTLTVNAYHEIQEAAAKLRCLLAAVEDANAKAN